MLSLLKNKIRNKFLQTDYIHPYIIWCIDVFLSVISSFSIFLFFHYLINISIHFNQQRYILLIAVISSIVWTGICKTYEGIIRYSTLVELTRIIYAMLLKALTFVLFAYITLDYIGLFIYSIIITDFISSVFLLMCTRILTVNFYYHLLQLLKKPRQATLIYGISERGISLANYLRSENNPYNVFGFITRKPENKKYRLVGYQIYLIDEENSLRKLFSTLKVNCILFLSHTDLRNDEEIVQYGLENHICLRIAPFLTEQTQWSKIQLRNIQIEDLLSREEINIDLDNIRNELSGSVIMVTGAANYLRSENNPYNVFGFITRKPENKKYRLVGYQIYLIDEENSLRKLFSTLKVNCILFLSHTDLRNDEEIVQYGLENHICLRIAPFLTEQTQWSKIQLRNIQIEDLLSREEINIDLDNIRNELSGSVIMVTGAAGSIGSELCRQLCCFNLKQLILFDFSETATYEVDMELKKRFPDRSILPIIGDVRNRDRVESQTRLYHPDIIFHAAAYKHVPMMEKYPCEAVRTNVLGTSIMADTALKYGVKKFIMISTDKAVNPSSVMGATKRLAEMYVQSLGSAIQEGNIIGKTSFITTRFGNVLGSNGSVIPLFRQQIMEGGPVTVTHPDIIRYFMTIPEACRLVLEAVFMGQGNDIFIFDMGKPVKITDMACRMIKLAGLQPDKDIEIVYTGLRPGEKLYEELLYNEENSTPTLNPKIFKGISLKQDYDKIKPALQQLVEVAQTDNKKETVYQLKQIVPEFKSMNSVYKALDEKTYISKKMKSNIMFN